MDRNSYALDKIVGTLDRGGVHENLQVSVGQGGLRTRGPIAHMGTANVDLFSYIASFNKAPSFGPHFYLIDMSVDISSWKLIFKLRLQRAVSSLCTLGGDPFSNLKVSLAGSGDHRSLTSRWTRG